MKIIRQLKQAAYVLLMAAALLAPAGVMTAAQPAYAAPAGYTGPKDANGNPCTQDPAGQQVLNGINANNDVGANCGQKKVNSLFAMVTNLISLIAGIVAIIVIIYAGMKYMTSGGEQSKVANAKSTLLYAIIGLAIASLTQLLVHFVLYRTSTI